MSSSGPRRGDGPSNRVQHSRDGNANEIARLQPRMVELQLRIDQLLPGFAKPEEFRNTASQIVEHFSNFRGRNLNREPITVRELSNLTRLLASFQSKTREYQYSKNSVQDLVIRQNNTMQELTDVVEKGMLHVASQAVLAGYSSTTGTRLREVEDFENIILESRNLMAQLACGTLSSPPQDPDEELDIGHDGLMQLLGNRALRNLHKDNSEGQGRQSFTGAQRRNDE